MRTNKFAIAAVLAAAALSANAAAPRTEGDIGPFTYEALGATPSLTFGRTQAAAPAAAATPKTAPAKNAAARTEAPARATSASTPFTYDTLGATPHVEARKSPRTEVLAQPAR
jgi:hypothetical protein